MPEFIIIDDEPVEVPAEIVSDSRAAVQAWYDAQLAARATPTVTRRAVAAPVPAPTAAPESATPTTE